MFARAAAVTLALVLVATMGIGPVVPQPAEANDTGKILAGLAAGALVYGMLDGIERDNRNYDRRGYYDGNRDSWKYERDRRQFERHQEYRYYGPQYRNSGSYERGWNNGYDRGYDNGWGDGFDYGRYGGGWWGY